MAVTSTYLAVGAAVVAALTILIYVWRGGLRKHNSASPRVRVQAVQLSELRRLPTSPLVEFAPDIKLSSRTLVEVLKCYCENTFTTLLQGDSIGVVVQGISLATDESDMVFSFSPWALELYRKGETIVPVHEASGKFLPFMQDRSGKIIELAKGSAKVPRIAQICSLVVSAAHIVSGIDLVKRLETINKSVDILVAGRGFDQDARLERLFSQARCILRLGLSEARLDQLFDIRYSLYELRDVWAREIKHSIAAIDKLPVRHAIHPTSWFRRQNRERNGLKDLDAVLAALESSQVALLIDSALAMATGTVTDLQDNVLIRERARWDEIVTSTQDAGTRFRREKPKKAFSAISDSIDQHATLISGLLGATGSKIVNLPK